MEKTNAMRLLDSRKVPYKLHTFSTEIHSATEVAEVLQAAAGAGLQDPGGDARQRQADAGDRRREPRD